METSVASVKETSKNQVRKSLATFKDIVDQQPELKRELDQVMSTEKRLFDGGVRQLRDVAKFAQSNWKTVLPVAAALGLGALFLRGRSSNK